MIILAQAMYNTCSILDIHKIIWYEKLLERLRNIRKRSKSDDLPIAKQCKGESSAKLALIRRYPPHVHGKKIQKIFNSAMVTELDRKKNINMWF